MTQNRSHEQIDGYVYIDSMSEIIKKVGSALTHTVNAPGKIEKEPPPGKN